MEKMTELGKRIKELLGKKNNLIVILLLGVLLLVIAIPVKDKDKGTDGGQSDSRQSGLWSGGSEEQSGAGGPGQQETQDYCAYMERKLEEALSHMDGAGKVRVLIALKASEEKIVEKDRPVTRSETSETDSQGGVREVNSTDSGESTVFSSGSGSSQPYVVKTMLPEIEGVIVLAQGAGTGNVSKNISDAVQVLFGIEAHKVKVIKMETED